MYRLDNEFTNGRFAVTVVGCGGTGGFVAEGICRFLPPEAILMLIDHDRVEERNILRQCFTMEDLGKFKAEALACRLSRVHRRPVAYITLPVAMVEITVPGLVIGCVDNGLARRDIAEAVKGSLYPPFGYRSWWVDAGNGENYGQVLVGNTDKVGLCTPVGDIYHGLPFPTVQRPDLLLQTPQARDCTSIAEEQGPTINLTMAAAVVEVVRRLLAGTCPWVQLYIDMETGTHAPVFVTPETIKALTERKGGRHGKRKR